MKKLVVMLAIMLAAAIAAVPAPAEGRTAGDIIEEMVVYPGKARSGRRFLGTNGATLWLWSCLPKPGAPGP